MLREFSDWWFQLNNHSWAPNDRACVSVLKQTRVCWNRTLSSTDWGLFTQELQFRFVSLCLVLVVKSNPCRHPALECFHSTLPPSSHNHLSFWLILTESKYEIQVEKRSTIDSGSVFLGILIARSLGQHLPISRSFPLLLHSHRLFTSALFNYHLSEMAVGFCFKKSVVLSVTTCISLELIPASSPILKCLHTPLMLWNTLMMPAL